MNNGNGTNPTPANTDDPGAPLAGVRVIDITRNIAGPFCAMMLGDMGANVIKIESPAGGDELRALFRYRGRRSTDQDYFYMFNRNKRSLAVDLKTPAGQEILQRLIRKSDVLLENLRPGVAERLGFSWPEVSRANRRIVYAALSGFGKSLRGPKKTRPAYDGVVQAATGVMALNSDADGKPRRVSMPLGDILSGMYAAYAIACALARVQRTGVGEYIDIAMFDSLLSVQGPAVIESLLMGTRPRLGNQVSHRVPQNVYEAADGKFVFLTTNEQSWRRLCEALSLQHLAEDPRFATNQLRVANRHEVDKSVGDRIRSLAAEKAEQLLIASGVPASVVRDIGDAIQSTDAADRNMLIRTHHPDSGEIPLLGFPYKMQRHPCEVRRPPPRLGEDTYALLTGLLDFTPDEAQAFADAGAIRFHAESATAQ